MFPSFTRHLRPSERIVINQTTIDQPIFPYTPAPLPNGYDKVYEAQTPSIRSRTLDSSSSRSTSSHGSEYQDSRTSSLRRARSTMNGPGLWGANGLGGWCESWVGKRDGRSPQLSAILAPSAPSEPYLSFDVRFPSTSASIHPAFGASTLQTPVILTQYYALPATQPPVSKMKIVSREFPWVITVENDRGVSIGDVVQKLYLSLQVPVNHSEWWIASSKTRGRVAASWESNVDSSGEGQYGDKPKFNNVRERSDCIRRVDWLLGKVFWIGLAYDKSFLSERGLGGQHSLEGAYVLRLKH